MRSFFRLSGLLLSAPLWFHAQAQISQPLILNPQAPVSANPRNPAVNAQTPRHTVMGTVVNAVTGEPISRALIFLNGPGQFTSFSGPDGRFQFDNVPEGTAFVTAQKPGFSYNAGGSYSAHAIRISDTTPDIQVKLTPQPKLTGRVVDSDGEPIEGLQVQAVSQRIVQGRKQLVPAASAATRGDGIYQIDNLGPGQCYVRTLIRPVYPGYSNAWFRNPNSAPEAGPAYRSEYYPGSPDLSSAQSLNLTGGQDVQADFTLPVEPTYQIRGVVSGAATNFVQITYEDSNGQSIPTVAPVNRRNGQFTISSVPAGSWTLHFYAPGQEGSSFTAEQTVTVSTSDVTGLQVVLQPTASIAVHINRPTSQPCMAQSGPAQADCGQANVRVLLIPSKETAGRRSYFATASPGRLTKNFGMVNMDSAQAGTPNSLTIAAVPPGTYRLSAQAYGHGCIDSASSGSVDLMNNDLTVSEGVQPQPIEISVSNNCASINGKIQAGSAAAAGMIVLLRQDMRSDPVITTSTPDGTFNVKNIAPGEYRAYAVSDLNNLEYANPDAMRNIPGKDLQIQANQQADLTLELYANGVGN